MTAPAFGPWLATTSTGSDLTTEAVIEGGAIVYNGFIYLLCGTTDGTDATPHAKYAPVASDGTVGAWSTTTGLTNPVGAFGVWAVTLGVWAGRMYIVGGSYSGTTSYVHSSPIDAVTGALGAWRLETTWTAGNWKDGPGILHDGYLYQVGGSSGGVYSTIVRLAAIDDVTGVVGSWSNTTAWAPRRRPSASRRAAGTSI